MKIGGLFLKLIGRPVAIGKGNPVKGSAFTDFANRIRSSRSPIVSPRAEWGHFCTFEISKESICLLDDGMGLVPVGLFKGVQYKSGMAFPVYFPFSSAEIGYVAQFITEASSQELEIRHRFPNPIPYYAIPDFNRANWRDLVKPYQPVDEGVIETLTALGVKTGDTVFDPSCGNGRLMLKIAQRFGCLVQAADIAESALREMDQAARAIGLPKERLVWLQSATQDLRPQQKARFVVLSGLLNYSVILNEDEAKTILRNVVDNCLAEGGFLLVSGITPCLFWSQEFERAGLLVQQKTNLAKSHHLYVLQKQGPYRELPSPLDHFTEMAARKEGEIVAAKQAIELMRRSSDDFQSWRQRNDRFFTAMRDLHQRKLSEGTRQLHDYFRTPIVQHMFSLIATLSETELAQALPGWSRDEIFAYFCLQDKG